MKLGNTSQSKVPVPDFFLNQTLKQMETFELSDRKRYFREKDLFSMTKDLNFCNNPRNYNRKYENFNKEKYIPDLTNINGILKNYSNIANNKKYLNAIISPKANSYENFRSFVEKTNVTNFTNPDLRQEIRDNITVLINRINDKFDLDKWSSTDTRINLMQQTNSESYYNTKDNFMSTNVNANIGNSNNGNPNDNSKNLLMTNSDKMFNETDERRFKTILRDKVNGMSIDKGLKIKLVKNYDKFGESTSDKFYKTKASTIIENFDSYKTPKNSNKNISKKDEFSGNERYSFTNKDKKKINSSKKEKNKMSNSLNLNFFYSNDHQDKDRKIINNSKKDNNSNQFNFFNSPPTNINHIKKNFNHTSNECISKDLIDINDKFNVGKITLPFVTTKYSTVNSDFYGNQEKVQKLRKENEKLYDRFKNTTLFRDFPSPDRKEFVVKKGEKLRTKTKKDQVDRNLSNFSNYNASKHKDVFCEDYDTNESVMVKFKKSKEVF